MEIILLADVRYFWWQLFGVVKLGKQIHLRKYLLLLILGGDVLGMCGGKAICSLRECLCGVYDFE